MSKTKDPQEIIKALRYVPFDPATMQELERDVRDMLEHRRAFHGLTDDSWMSVSDFTRFSLLNHLGWKRVGYESFLIEGGMMFWMTDVHAEAVGRALRPGLKALRLDLTTLAGDGFTVMANAAPAGVQLDELYVAHRSGDGITATETRGLARLVTKLRVRTLHLWASEYDPGALDELAAELGRLGNASLQEVDVCDLSKGEPNDRIVHAGLEAIVKANR